MAAALKCVLTSLQMGLSQALLLQSTAFRILNEEQESTHLNEISAEYKKKYFEGCGKSLSCHDICPIGLPVEELLVRSNAAAVWGK